MDINLEIASFGLGVIIFMYGLINISVVIKDITIPKLNLKQRLTAMIVGIILVIIGLLLSNSSMLPDSIEKTFHNPMYRGERVDNCLYAGGIACGAEAANAWCRLESNGYNFASNWHVENVSVHQIHSKRLGDEWVCERGDICSAFASITCHK